jgi:hypothetical protein
MRLPARTTTSLFAASLLSLLVLSACGDDDGAEPTATPTAEATATSEATATATPTSEPQPTETPTASPTLEPTATATSEPTATSTPTPTPETVELPQLPAGATVVTEGTRTLQLQSGAIAELDPVHVALDDVGEAPICAGLVAAWAWESAPEGAGGNVTVDAIRQGGGEQVGSGPTGSASLGCMLLRFRNGGPEQVEITVKYAIGDIG